MNHTNGGVRASGANAPVFPERLLALTTEALAFVSRDRAEGVARQWLAGVPGLYQPKTAMSLERKVFS